MRLLRVGYEYGWLNMEVYDGMCMLMMECGCGWCDVDVDDGMLK